jgi:hypothetical protein
MAFRLAALKSRFSDLHRFCHEPLTEEILHIAEKCGLAPGCAQAPIRHPYRSPSPISLSEKLNWALEKRLEKAKLRLEKMDSVLPFAAIGSGSLSMALSGSVLLSCISVSAYAAFHFLVRSRSQSSAEESYYHDRAVVSVLARLIEVR